MGCLRRANASSRELLRRLLADYLLEFDGQTEPYRYFDAYWTEPERRPFLIEDEGEVAGFCLIRDLGDGWHIAEFSVLPEKRRSGVGRAAVEDLVEQASAAGAAYLEATVHREKSKALAFWLAVRFEIVSQSELTVTRRAL